MKLFFVPKKLFFLLALLLLLPFLVLGTRKILEVRKGAQDFSGLEVKISVHGCHLSDLEVGDRCYLSTSVFDPGGYFSPADFNYYWSASSTGSLFKLSHLSGQVTDFIVLEEGVGDLVVTARSKSFSEMEPVIGSLRVEVGVPVATSTPVLSPTPFLSPTPEPSLPGDVNGDGVVNIVDLVIVGANFGRRL